jgi:hypothetical protein
MTLIFLMQLIGFTACQTNRQTQLELQLRHREDSAGGIQEREIAIYPGHCRIVATVVGIDSSVRTEDLTGPCAKAPCRTRIRVEDVLGYGSAFPRPLAKGDVVSARFMFTVAPTKDLFPSMTQSYPGVSIGSKIVTDIQAIQQIGDNAEVDAMFLVYAYSIKQ